jgi:hypothetical protein
MDFSSLRTRCWRSAAARSRRSHLAPFKFMVAFAMDQVLQFWPPYRDEQDCGGPPDAPLGDQGKRLN